MSGRGSDDVRVIPREEDVEIGDLWSSRPGGPRSTRRSRAIRTPRAAHDRGSEEVGGRRARRTRRRELRRARRRRIATVIGLILVLIAAVGVAVVLLPDLRGPGPDRGAATLRFVPVSTVTDIPGQGMEEEIGRAHG